MALEKYREMRTFVTEGYKSLRVLCFCGGLAMTFSGFLGMFNILSPFRMLIETYLCMAGILVTVLEMKKCFLSDLFMDKIEFWCKFLTRTWGRGFFYMFIGSIALSQWTLLNVLIGGYMVVMGAACVSLGWNTAEQINTLKHQLQKGEEVPVQEPDSAMVKETFQKFDTDKSGYIYPSELKSVCRDLGMDLTDGDVEAAVRYMDTDSAGRIEFAEFKKWWVSTNVFAP